MINSMINFRYIFLKLLNSILHGACYTQGKKSKFKFYNLPILARVGVKPYSATSLKASGSPTGLHSFPLVTTNLP